MKLKKIFISIYISVLVLFVISLTVLSILGNKERVGYLGNLTFVSSESNQNNYIYSFKINYYDKVFRNSDIYGVYLNTNSLPDYIKEIKMNDNFGTPFGNLVSLEKLEEEKIDNIKYFLKLRLSNLFVYLILFNIFFISLYIFRKFVFNIFHYILFLLKKYRKLLLIYSIIYILFWISLSILGRINREGYLSDISIDTDNTLKLNNINIGNIKKLFSIEDQLDYSLLTNYIFTNSNILKYSYNFRIKYYNKVFRNSDIYGVYLNTNNLPDYISNVKFQEKGSPFGILVSSKIIEQEKMDNIEYSLKIKYSFFIIIIISICLCSILLYNFSFIIFDFIKLIYNIKLLKKINLKNKYVYILVIFLCFLIMPNIIYFLFGQYFDKTNYEKRTKAEKPIFSINNLSKYPQEYEKYFNDYIPFRNELIQKKVYFDLILFNNFINTSHTLIGKEDWLFMKRFPIIEQYIGKYMFTDEELEIVKKNLTDFRDKLKNNNIDLVIMIVPEKSMVYGNYLPDYIQKIKCETNITEQLVEYINENTDIKIVYPRDELIKYRNKYQLYYKYDDHWNHLGGYIGYSRLMKSININLPSIDKFEIYKTGYDDINKITGIWNALIWLINLPPTKRYSNQYNYYISNFTTNNYKIIEGKRGPHENLTCISDSINDMHITIFRDSYTCAMFDYFASSFYKTTFIYNLSGDMNIPNDTNLVFFTFIERFIKDILLDKIKNINIDDNLETNSITNNN